MLLVPSAYTNTDNIISHFAVCVCVFLSFFVLFVGLLYIRLTRYLNSFHHLNVHLSVVAFFYLFLCCVLFCCLSNTLNIIKFVYAFQRNSIFEFIDAINVIFGVSFSPCLHRGNSNEFFLKYFHFILRAK